MVSFVGRAKLLVLFGLVVVALLAIGCAKSKEAAAPASGAPAAALAPLSPSPAPATPAPAASPAPATPTPAAPAAPGAAPAAVTTAVRIDPRSDEPGSTFVKGLLQYHPNALPMWQRAKYGGERVGPTLFNTAIVNNPLRAVQLGRPTYFGTFFVVDMGTCSLAGRTDFSRCDGKRVNNLGGVLVPGLIERWEQVSPTVIDMKVREGVLWPAIPPMIRTDRSVTAEDVKWYFEQQKKTGVYGPVFALVDKIEVQDKYRLRLAFSSPHADFIRSVGSAGLGIVSRECFEEAGCLDNKIISPGPFIVKSYVARQRSEIERNPEFWLKGLPYVDRMIGLNIADPTAQRAAFITGQIDYLATSAPAERDLLLKQYPGQTVHATLCTCGSAHFEMRMDRAPWNDVRVRKAISMAIDRSKAWQVAREGFDAMGMPMAFDYLGLELPVSIKEAGPSNQYNPTEAKRLLTEAGYGNGLKVSLQHSWRSYNSVELIISVIDDLQKIGVQLDQRVIDGVAASQIQLGKNWDGLWFSQCWLCGSTDSDSYLFFAVSTSPTNYMGINDRFIDQLYVKARSELDPAKRQALLWDFTRYMYDNAYGIHFGTPTQNCHFAPWLMNGACHVYGYANVHNMTGWIMWVDPDKRK